MPAYLIANYRITNPDSYKQYLAVVGPTVFAHGGKILVADQKSTPKEGDPAPVSVVLEFPSRKELECWYNSSEYQAIIHHRTDNTDGLLVFADGFVLPG